MQLTIEQLTVNFGVLRAVDQVSLQLERGQIGCLLGPSGCGKTTVLRAIAGFELPEQGRILIRGREVSRSGWGLAPEQRRVGMVFQDYALFPHLNVHDNIAFGLHGTPAGKSRERVMQLLELVDMRTYGDAYPHQLSGGQQQRIALARAMAPRPDLLLLDEPFGSQDAELREQLAKEVRSLLHEDSITALLVTHDQFEAFAMADHIGVMNRGELHQWGSAYELYHRPADLFVGDFIGRGTLLPATRAGACSISTELGELSGQIVNDLNGDRFHLLIRPDDVIHDDSAGTTAKIVDRAFRGAEFLYTLALPSGNRILCMAPSHHDHKIGQRIGIRLEVEHLVLFSEPAATPIDKPEDTVLD
ncbi:MAG: ABC transporter ATP-binding protein [Gammaproteobacteria bacterium]|nr:ABC transporter ATP-binding protein [Gammaproteobacteria bacterium]